MRRPVAASVLALLAALTPAAGARAQPAAVSTPAAGSFSPGQRAEIIEIMREALRSDPSILRDAVEALQKDQQNRQAENATKAIAANHAAIFAAPEDPVLGNPRAKATLVEFFDVRCPYCRRMRPAIDALLQQDHDVRIVMKDLPILGPASVLGAKALLAAQAQGGYQKMQDALMREGVTVDLPTIQKAAVAAGLDWAALQQRMNAPAIQKRIDANLALARLLDLQGTPAIIYGDQLIPGALSLDELEQIASAARKA